MKTFCSFILIAGFVFITYNPVKAQLKIGYVNLDSLLAEMPETKKADSLINRYYEALIAELQNKRKDFDEKIMLPRNCGGSPLPDSVKDKKRKELQEVYMNLAQEEERIQQQVQNKQKELLTAIRKKAIETIQYVAHQNKYDYILTGENILFILPGDNITLRVKKKLGII